MTDSEIKVPSDEEVEKAYKHLDNFIQLKTTGDADYRTSLLQCMATFIRAARQRDNPTADGTTNAHPAWWRGHDQTIAILCQYINEILDGKRDTTAGIASEPWQATKVRLGELVRQRRNAVKLAEMVKDQPRLIVNEWFVKYKGCHYRPIMDALADTILAQAAHVPQPGDAGEKGSDDPEWDSCVCGHPRRTHWDPDGCHHLGVACPCKVLVDARSVTPTPSAAVPVPVNHAAGQDLLTAQERKKVESWRSATGDEGSWTDTLFKIIDRLAPKPPEPAKPLPCPFCGKEPTVLGAHESPYGAIQIFCKCAAVPSVEKDSAMADVIKIWNTRASTA